MDIKLLTYLEKEILPLYDYLDDAHGRHHIENTVNFAMDLVKIIPEVKPEMVITAATYHDLGNLKDREKHHIHSAQYVIDDKNLETWFSEEEIAYIATACLEHRASELQPTSILSKIIADADRSDSIDITRMMERSYFYTKSKYIDTMTHEEILDEVYSHLSKKYGQGGYVKFNLKETEKLLGESLQFSQDVLSNKDLFMATLNMFILGRDVDMATAHEVPVEDITEEK